MTDITLDRYLQDVFPSPLPKKNKQLYQYEFAKTKSNREWAKYFFENGSGNDLPEVKGSLWAALNGITEFVDHRVTKQTQDRRVNSLWLGYYAAVKGKAYRLAVDTIKN